MTVSFAEGPTLHKSPSLDGLAWLGHEVLAIAVTL